MTAIKNLNMYSMMVKGGFTTKDNNNAMSNALAVLFKKKYLTKKGKITKKGLAHAQKIDMKVFRDFGV